MKDYILEKFNQNERSIHPKLAPIFSVRPDAVLHVYSTHRFPVKVHLHHYLVSHFTLKK